MIVDTPGIKGWVKDRSVLSKKRPLIKIRYSLDKGIDPERVMDLLTEKRKIWDISMLKYESHPIEEGWTIYRYVTKPPVSLLNPMYSVEKRLVFKDKETYYGYYTSVPDNILPLEGSYKRYHMIFGGTILRKENDEYAYYTLSQVDMHLNNTIQSLAMKFVPENIQNFYRTFKEVLYNV